MILSKLLPVVVGLGAGILVSAGVFTVLLSVGLVPRFAGKTHTGEKIFLYEEMVVFGTLVGCLASVFPGAVIFGREWLQKRLEAGAAFEWLVLTAEALTGLFAENRSDASESEWSPAFLQLQVPDSRRKFRQTDRTGAAVGYSAGNCVFDRAGTWHFGVFQPYRWEEDYVRSDTDRSGNA